SVAPAVSRVRTIFSLVPNAAAPSSVRPWHPRQPACPLAPASISRVKRSKFPSAAACSRGARSHSFHCSEVASLWTSLKISISKPSSREQSSSSRFEADMVLDCANWTVAGGVDVLGWRCLAGKLRCLGWQE
ncbi:unnamed protein product, partial [Ectocarpus sp. 12 AP-2014]